MTATTLAATERTFVLSPIGLLPVDDFTGGAPVGWIRASLERLEGSDWRPTGIDALVTPRGVIAYPGLERRVHAAGANPVQYRVKLQAQFYVPIYPPRPDGSDPAAFEFQAQPFNEGTQPAGQPPPQTAVQLAFLLPAPNYPFSPEVPVLRGLVVDTPVGKPVAGVDVSAKGNTHRVRTDSRGEFGLPLRWAKLDPTIDLIIDAMLGANGPQGDITVHLPADLDKSHTIPIQ